MNCTFKETFWTNCGYPWWLIFVLFLAAILPWLCGRPVRPIHFWTPKLFWVSGFAHRTPSGLRAFSRFDDFRGCAKRWATELGPWGYPWGSIKLFNKRVALQNLKGLVIPNGWFQKTPKFQHLFAVPLGWLHPYTVWPFWIRRDQLTETTAKFKPHASSNHLL